MQQKAAWYDTE